jgi:VWFA-related protein
LIASEELSVMLALDTSGSMKEHGRMEQARAAAGVFLSKLPKTMDCGLILFDHEVRQPVLRPTFDRSPLLTQINSTPPRGGTAYIDAASEAVAMLRHVKRGRPRAVVLMTDGIDLNSKKTITELIKEATAAPRVPINTIGLGEPGKFEPVNTVLALDHSGSMKLPADDRGSTPKIKDMQNAAERFVDSMSSEGRVSVIAFSSEPQPATRFRKKAESAKLKQWIRGMEARGETAVFDATYDAICVLDADNSKGRRAVVAMTDGIDNSSRRRVEEVIARAKESNVPLYMLGFGRAGEIDEATMTLMATATGGKFFHAKNKDELIEIFEKISGELHDDGIDEKSLRLIAEKTGGQYYPAKNVSDLKMIFEKVAADIKPTQREEIFRSLNQRADGTERKVTLSLIETGSGGSPDRIIDETTTSYQTRGLLVAEMSPLVYFALLIAIGALIALPGLMRRSSTG